MSDIAPQDNSEDEQVIIIDLDPPGEPLPGLPALVARLLRSPHAPAFFRWSRVSFIVLAGLLVAAVLFQPPAFFPTSSRTTYAASTTYSSSTISTIVSSTDSQPAILDMSVNNGTIYMITSDGAIAAYRAGDGSLLWRHFIAGGQLTSVIATNQAIYCLQMKGVYGRVVALYPDGGMIAWEQKIPIVAATEMQLAGGIIYLHSSQGMLYALSGDGGHILWSAPIMATLPPDAFVSVENGYVALETPQSDFDIRRAFDGKLIYRYSPSPYATQELVYPTIQGGIIYINDNNSVEARSANDGSLLWRYRSSASNSWQPLIQDGIVLVRNNSNALLALRGQDGKPLWKYATNAPMLFPVIAHQTIYLQLPDSKIVALRESDGTVLWQAQLPPPTDSNVSDPSFDYLLPPDIDNEMLYLTMFLPGKTVYALRASDGDLLWHRAFADNRFTYSPLMANGVIVLGKDDFTIDAFDEFDGQPLWKFHSTAQMLWQPIVDAGLLFIRTIDFSLNAVRLSDGKLLWQYPASG